MKMVVMAFSVISTSLPMSPPRYSHDLKTSTTPRERERGERVVLGLPGSASDVSMQCFQLNTFGKFP